FTRPQSEFLRVLPRHKHIIAPGAGKRINFGMNDAVELLSAAGGQQEPARRDPLLRGVGCWKVAPTVWSQAAIHQKPRATVLKVVTLLFEGSNSFICRTNAVNLTADVLRVLPGEKFCAALRIEFARYENRNFPFVFGFRQVWAAGN